MIIDNNEKLIKLITYTNNKIKTKCISIYSTADYDFVSEGYIDFQNQDVECDFDIMLPYITMKNANSLKARNIKCGDLYINNVYLTGDLDAWNIESVNLEIGSEIECTSLKTKTVSFRRSLIAYNNIAFDSFKKTHSKYGYIKSLDGVIKYNNCEFRELVIQ